MTKTITKRDLVVIQCVLAWDPNIAGITIHEYVSIDSVAPRYLTAIVSVPGLRKDIYVKVKKEMSGQCVPVSVSIPSVTDEFVSTMTVYSVLRGPEGVVLRKR